MPRAKGPKAKPMVNPQQAKFAEEYLRTGKKRDSAAAAGYKCPSDKANQLLHHPGVASIIHEVRDTVSKKLSYTADTAMLEAEDAIAFAKDTGNANALVKAIELRSKIMGLLVDKHEFQGTPFHLVLPTFGPPMPIHTVIDVKSEVLELPSLPSLGQETGIFE